MEIRGVSQGAFGKSARAWDCGDFARASLVWKKSLRIVLLNELLRKHNNTTTQLSDLK
jgi:hypothetical protein